ncbi:hypothetical protein Taro_016731 [Colocasia esculenta]|uniref:CXXC motif containing zinc binding protein n=1 Tax=Colocasia esculenta TaxID=4460 RepID=A0A843UL41_COLES|nr:hypothetical protein [Colocasia esculenta]
MPLFLLSFKADLDNLTDLQPRGGCDDPNYGYFLKLKCEGCGEITQKETCVMLSETVAVPNSRGTANLVQRCKFCAREGSVLMIPGHGKPLTLQLSEAQLPTPLMVFECRGFEPVEFVFGDGWTAQSRRKGAKYLMEPATPSPPQPRLVEERKRRWGVPAQGPLPAAAARAQSCRRGLLPLPPPLAASPRSPALLPVPGATIAASPLAAAAAACSRRRCKPPPAAAAAAVHRKEEGRGIAPLPPCPVSHRASRGRVRPKEGNGEKKEKRKWGAKM